MQPGRDFIAWYEAERPTLYATLAVVSGDVDLAAEAADEALARAYERWDRVGKMDSPGAGRSRRRCT